MTDAVLVGLDWGTSSLRMWRYGPDGTILDRTRSELGIARVVNSDFRAVFDAIVGACSVPLPAIMAGMIGSRQGWVEAPYVACPTDVRAIADGLQPVPDVPQALIVPGISLAAADGRRDVMRGEETQILGAGVGGGRRLVVLPGTHSKWVVLDDGVIRDFVTFMSGELYQALRQHTILGRLMAPGDVDPDRPEARASFAAGVARMLDAGAGGLMQSLFSIRARGLFGDLSAEAAPSYLSGLLIGAEVCEGLALARRWGMADVAPLIIGGDLLVGRYLAAFRQAGHESRTAGEETGARGLWMIARQRGLVA